jgi:hypothetical protein
MKSFDPWSTIVTDESGDIVWPQPSYVHSFYREVPSWIHYGDNGTRRLLFDGTFIGADGPSARAEDPLQMLEVATMMQPYVYAGHRMGAEAPPTIPGGAEPRRGLLAEVAPHVAPATGPISVKKAFDERQILHVEICVDGKCYRTSMNLGPAIMLVMEKLAQWHKDQHALMAQHPAQGQQQLPVTTDVIGAVDDAIAAAGDAMADTLVCHHVNVMTGSFFDDVGSAIGGTLRELAPVISTVATGVATYYGGPEAGAVAGKLAPVVTSLQANLLDPKGNPQQKAAAQQSLQRVSQVAQTDPRAAQALAAAHQAVRDTAIAYHVKGAVDRAVAGDPGARQDVGAVVQAADRGDPAAKSTYEVMAQVLIDKAQHSAWGQQLWNKIMGIGGQGGAVTTSAGWYCAPVVGSFWDDVGNAVLTVTGTKATNQFIHDHGLEPYVKFASQAVATYYGGPAAGAAAGALSPMVMKLGVEDKGKAVAAQQDVQGVTAMAQQHSPQMAQAVDVAKGSIKGVSTAYHINHLLKLAKGGDARAQRALARLQSLASSGNPNAQRALQAVNAIHQEQTRTAVSGWYDVVGAVISAGGESRGHRFSHGRW